MKSFLLFLFLISGSNCVLMGEIEKDSENHTLNLSTAEETYFYVKNYYSEGYFKFIFYDNITNFSISDVCYTDINPFFLFFQ